MRNEPYIRFPQVLVLAGLCLLAVTRFCLAGGVTLITHGLNGNVNGWISGMADQIPNYPRFLGTHYTTYRMYFFLSGGSYFLTSVRESGAAPTDPESGEIIIKLDWSQLSDGNSYNTYQIASAVAPALLDTNFIAELGGHALAEFPLHFVGHSRGGSLICELSRILGTNGVWVDQITTLDPHPLNDSQFPLDGILYSAVDAPAQTYTSVLFSDNYWQNLDFLVHGKSVSGAYVRKLTSLSGGYSGTGADHSNVHLWYHGTIDLRTPTSDTEASLTSSQRSTWWSPSESSGTNAGFLYSLIGGADRTTTNRPVSGVSAAIKDGFNQWWDLGAGAGNNRTALPFNAGLWPSLIRFDRTQTNDIIQGQGSTLRFYYQSAQPATTNATVSIYLDDDLNPLNGNDRLLQEIPVPGTGAGFINVMTTNVLFSVSNVPPGLHALYAKITGGGRTRYLYAPELVEILAANPALDIAQLSSTQIQIGINGFTDQTIVLQASPDLQSWMPLATNLMTTTRWVYTNNVVPNLGEQFYRAVVGP